MDVLSALYDCTPFACVAALVVLGLYCCIFRRNIIKVIIGVSIIESGANLLLIAHGYRTGSVAPIYTSSPLEGAAGINPANYALPIPQALTLTSIVIGVAVAALMLSLAIHIYRKYGTLDVRKITKLKG